MMQTNHKHLCAMIKFKVAKYHVLDHVTNNISKIYPVAYFLSFTITLLNATVTNTTNEQQLLEACINFPPDARARRWKNITVGQIKNLLPAFQT
jgi:hypothetical protein